MSITHGLLSQRILRAPAREVHPRWRASGAFCRASGNSGSREPPSPDLQRMMDGPDLSLMRYPNLGQIAGMLDKDSNVAPADARAMLEAPSSSFKGGLYFDGPAVFGSLVLFLLMIALSFGRILGVDSFVNKKLKEWREQKRERERWEIIDARQRLEDRYRKEE